jgi:hypothetical protein
MDAKKDPHSDDSHLAVSVIDRRVAGYLDAHQDRAVIRQ